jgi:hypothetical protein
VSQAIRTLQRSPDFPASEKYAHTEKRYAVVFGASFFPESHAGAVWGRVCNISAGGLMAVLPTGVRMSGRVAIDIKHIGRLFGRIAWSRDGKFGVSLDEQVDPEALLRARASRARDTLPAVNAFSSVAPKALIAVPRVFAGPPSLVADPR